MHYTVIVIVIVIIELFQDTISVILRNVGTKAKALKKYHFREGGAE